MQENSLGRSRHYQIYSWSFQKQEIDFFSLFNSKKVICNASISSSIKQDYIGLQITSAFWWLKGGIFEAKTNY